MSQEQSLADYLNELGADADAVQQGFRHYLAEQTDDLPTEAMRQQLLNAAGDEPLVQSQLIELEQSSERLEEVALLYLSEAWDDPAERDAIKAALIAATQKLPVIELSIIAIVGMYGMYLLATGGKSRTRRRTVHKRDGSFVTEEDTTFASPAEWVKGIVSLFPGGNVAKG